MAHGRAVWQQRSTYARDAPQRRPCVSGVLVPQTGAGAVDSCFQLQVEAGKSQRKKSKFPGSCYSFSRRQGATQGWLGSPQGCLEFALELAPSPRRFHLEVRRRIRPRARLRPEAAGWRTGARCGSSAVRTLATRRSGGRACRASLSPKRGPALSILASSCKWKLASPREKNQNSQEVVTRAVTARGQLKGGLIPRKFPARMS